MKERKEKCIYTHNKKAKNMFQIVTTVIQSKKNYFSFFSYSYLSVFMYLYATFVQELAEEVSDLPEVKLWAVGSCLMWV